jgi:hypothetical protein
MPNNPPNALAMKELVLLQWTEEEQITFEDVPSARNPSHLLSKPTACVKFYVHIETSSWDSDAHNTSALSNASRVSLTSLTETYVNFFFSNTSVRGIVGLN